MACNGLQTVKYLTMLQRNLMLSYLALVLLQPEEQEKKKTLQPFKRSVRTYQLT